MTKRSGQLRLREKVRKSNVSIRYRDKKMAGNKG